MTKQIIIDGVDVSECENLIKGKQDVYCGIANSTEYNKCSHNPNCYYRQIKKTQQELQEAMDNYVKATNYYEDKLAQIKRIINEVEN